MKGKMRFALIIKEVVGHETKHDACFLLPRWIVFCRTFCLSAWFAQWPHNKCVDMFLSNKHWCWDVAFRDLSMDHPADFVLSRRSIIFIFSLTLSFSRIEKMGVIIVIINHDSYLIDLSLNWGAGEVDWSRFHGVAHMASSSRTRPI